MRLCASDAEGGGFRRACYRDLRQILEPEPLSSRKLIGVSFSLAGMLLARTWADVDQVTTATAAYRLGSGAPRTFEAVALVAVLMLTGLFAGLILTCQHVKNRTAAGVATRTVAAAAGLAIGSFVLLIAEEVSVRTLASSWLSRHEATQATFQWASRLVRWAVIPGLLAAGVLWFPQRTWAAAQVIATVMIPFAAWRTGDAAYHLVRSRSPAIEAKGPFHPRAGAKPPWIVWVIFDEMDQFAALEDPTNAPLMPTLRAFRNSAF